MRRVLLCGVFVSLLAHCGATSGDGPSTTPTNIGVPDAASRFDQLEGSASELDTSLIGDLPDVAEQDRYFIVDAAIGDPEHDETSGAVTLVPPENWVVGMSDDDEEIRLDFLEPEGGAVAVELSNPPSDWNDVMVTWIVRYERRNVLLTEAGASVALHVIPVAARLELEGGEELFWIASAASLTR